MLNASRLAALHRAHRLTAMFRFAAVGAVTTCLDIAVFAALAAAGVAPTLANVASYSCGIALSYTLNRRWTFRRRGSLMQALKFVLATTSGLLLSTILLALLTKVIPPLPAKLATLPVVFLWNYYSTKLWAFREASSPSEFDNLHSGSLRPQA